MLRYPVSETAALRCCRSFSLRTLLAAVTIVGVVFGWERHVVARRRALREQFVADGGTCVMGQGWGLYRRWDDPPQISFWRHWLGDEPVGWLHCFEKDPVHEQLPILRNAFPEAIVFAFPEDCR